MLILLLKYEEIFDNIEIDLDKPLLNQIGIIKERLRYFFRVNIDVFNDDDFREILRILHNITDIKFLQLYIESHITKEKIKSFMNSCYEYFDFSFFDNNSEWNLLDEKFKVVIANRCYDIRGILTDFNRQIMITSNHKGIQLVDSYRKPISFKDMRYIRDLTLKNSILNDLQLEYKQILINLFNLSNELLKLFLEDPENNLFFILNINNTFYEKLLEINKKYLDREKEKKKILKIN